MRGHARQFLDEHRGGDPGKREAEAGQHGINMTEMANARVIQMRHRWCIDRRIRRDHGGFVRAGYEQR